MGHRRELDIAIVNTPAPRLPPTAHHILDEEMMLAYGASISGAAEGRLL